jgi:predicted N-acetyltransferase YhbS
VIIRPETAADHDAIRKINDEAFGDPIEAKLVAAIRESDRFLRCAACAAGRSVGGSPLAPEARHRHRTDGGDDPDR